MQLLPHIVALSALIATSVASPTWPRHDLVELGAALSRTICGDISPSRVETTPNPYIDGATDQVEIRTCAAGESRILLSQTASDTSGLPLFVMVLSADTPLPLPIRVGAHIDGIHSYLGQPTQTLEERQTFSLSESDDMLVIESRDGIIVSVSWQFYSG